MKMRIKPAVPELKIPNPATGKDLPAKGLVVEMNDFWRRRIESGEVMVVNEPPKEKKPAKKPVGKAQDSAPEKQEG